jgi:hypothetical protein
MSEAQAQSSQPLSSDRVAFNELWTRVTPR